MGVFGIFSSLNRGLDKLGIHTDGLGTTTVAGALRSDRPLDPEVARLFQMGVEHVYQQFLQHVAAGRQMQVADVAKVAEGRVWSGLDAQRLGLVDHLGGFDAAIEAAAKRAGIAADYRTIELQPPLDFPTMLMENLFGETEGKSVLASLLQTAGIADLVKLFASVRDYVRLNDPNQIYAFSELPY